MATYTGILLSSSIGAKSIQSQSAINDPIFIQAGSRATTKNNGGLIQPIILGTRLTRIYDGELISSVFIGMKKISVRDGEYLHGADVGVRTAHRIGEYLDNIIVDSNAADKFNLTVTPTHQYRSQVIFVHCAYRSDTPLTGKYQFTIEGLVAIPYGEEDSDLRTIDFDIAPEELQTGVNICRIDFIYANGTQEYLEFDITKEDLKREIVERTFKTYDGGYDGEYLRSAPNSLTVSPCFLVPDGADSTVITTTEFTRISLAKYASIMGVNVDASGAKVLVSFDGGISWKSIINNNWQTVDITNIAEYGMTPEAVNSISQVKWSDIFMPTSIDFAVYLDNIISNYANVLFTESMVIRVFDYYWRAWDKPGYLSTHIHGSMNMDAGVGSSVRLYYIDGSEVYIPKQSTFSIDFDGINMKCPRAVTSAYSNLSGSCAPQMAYLKSISLDITPRLKTGYAFIM